MFYILVQCSYYSAKCENSEIELNIYVNSCLSNYNYVSCGFLVLILKSAKIRTQF